MQVKDKSNYNFEKPFLYVPCREASWHKTEPAVRLLPDDAIGIQYIEFWDMGWSSCDHQHCVRKGSLDLNVETSLHWCTSWKRRTQGDLPWAPSEARHLGASPQLLGGG